MALKFGSDGWLIPGSDPALKVDTNTRTAKTGNWAAGLGGKPAGVVWHWTGGRSGDADGTKSWLRDWAIKAVVDPERSASWHFLIGRDGSIYQHAPITVSTWHAGCNPNKSNCKPTGQIYAYPSRLVPPIPIPLATPTRRYDANSFFIGVELENAGIALKQGDKWYVWPYAAQLTNCSGKSMCSEVGALAKSSEVKFESAYEISPGRVVTVNGVSYDTNTQSQIRAATELTRAMKEALGWWSPRQVAYGHSQFIDSKLDPGAFWMNNVIPDIQRKVFGSTAGAVSPGVAWALGLTALAAAGGGYWWWNRKGRPLPQFVKSRLPVKLQPQLAASPLDGTVSGDMGLLKGILNGGFFTGSSVPAGFGNLAELPPIDGSHNPFKRKAELIGTGVDPDGEVHDDITVTDAPRERKQSEKWECEWQPVGTGRPDGSGALAKSKVSEYMSEQLCTPIGEEVARHKPGYTKVVRIRKKTKQKYNKNYKKLLKIEKAEKKYENRNHGTVDKQSAQPNYKKRKTAWPKFENNPTFAARMKREQNKSDKAKADAAVVAEAKAAKKAVADKKAAAAQAKAAPKKEAAPKQAKQAKSKKAATA